MSIGVRTYPWTLGFRPTHNPKDGPKTTRGHLPR